jgi:hypothetical protein
MHPKSGTLRAQLLFFCYPIIRATVTEGSEEIRVSAAGLTKNQDTGKEAAFCKGMRGGRVDGWEDMFIF